MLASVREQAAAAVQKGLDLEATRAAMGIDEVEVQTAVAIICTALTSSTMSNGLRSSRPSIWAM